MPSLQEGSLRQAVCLVDNACGIGGDREAEILQRRVFTDLIECIIRDSQYPGATSAYCRKPVFNFEKVLLARQTAEMPNEDEQ